MIDKSTLTEPHHTSEESLKHLDLTKIHSNKRAINKRYKRQKIDRQLKSKPPFANIQSGVAVDRAFAYNSGSLKTMFEALSQWN
jgi:hypothetical protein